MLHLHEINCYYKNNKVKLISLFIMALFYVGAGVYHFMRPQFYQKIMPPWLPYHLSLIYISGAAEIILGALLFFPQTRVVAAWGIIVLLVAVFPANVQMLLNFIRIHHPYTWAAALRLPLQLILIWWAWLFTF